MAKKGGKKKGGKKATPEQEITTTRYILAERARCMCPRLGDAYARSESVGEVRADVVFYCLRKVVAHNLDTLDVSGGELGLLPEEIRERPEMHALTDVNLSRNKLFNSDHVFSILSCINGLRKLDLTGNFLNGTLSTLAGRLRELEELRLDANQLVELPPAVDAWTELRVFSAAENAISALPSQVGECKELLTLDLRGNSLTSLPIELAQCTKLEFLHLGGNRVAEIGEELCAALVNIRELYLYRNKLDVLPPQLGCLSQLKKLSLSGNNIKALPPEIGACVHLSELYLNNNQKLSSMPSSMSKLKMLRELSARRYSSYI